MDEDVAAPDPVRRAVGDGHRLDSGLDDLDVLLQAGLGHCTFRDLDVVPHRIEGDRAEPVVAHEANRVTGVPCADVDHELSSLRAELGERVEQPLCAAWLEALLQLGVERAFLGPELAVELLD